MVASFFAEHCGNDLSHAQQRAFFNAFGGGDDDGIWLQLAAGGDFLKDGAAMVRGHDADHDVCSCQRGGEVTGGGN